MEKVDLEGRKTAEGNMSERSGRQAQPAAALYSGPVRTLKLDNGTGKCDGTEQRSGAAEERGEARWGIWVLVGC